MEENTHKEAIADTSKTTRSSASSPVPLVNMPYMPCVPVCQKDKSKGKGYGTRLPYLQDVLSPGALAGLSAHLHTIEDRPGISLHESLSTASPFDSKIRPQMFVMFGVSDPNKHDACHIDLPGFRPGEAYFVQDEGNRPLAEIIAGTIAQTLVSDGTRVPLLPDILSSAALTVLSLRLRTIEDGSGTTLNDLVGSATPWHPKIRPQLFIVFGITDPNNNDLCYIDLPGFRPGEAFFLPDEGIVDVFEVDCECYEYIIRSPRDDVLFTGYARGHTAVAPPPPPPPPAPAAGALDSLPPWARDPKSLPVLWLTQRRDVDDRYQLDYSTSKPQNWKLVRRRTWLGDHKKLLADEDLVECALDDPRLTRPLPGNGTQDVLTEFFYMDKRVEIHGTSRADMNGSEYRKFGIK